VAKTWQEILDDPMYGDVLSNIQTSLTLSAQGSGDVGFFVDQTAADYGKPEYSGKSKWGDKVTAASAAKTPELQFLLQHPDTVMQVIAGSTAGLTQKQKQDAISGTIGSMGQKWGETSQDTAGKILEEKLIEMGKIEKNKQGWMSNIAAYVDKLAESKNVDVGGLLSTVGQTMEDDEWSPYDD
tara:strand:- start:52 stop:600 length:549 start_codon:yes stop_codon:yes gene_type:complete